MRRVAIALPLLLGACQSILGIGETVPGAVADTGPPDGPLAAPVRVTVRAMPPGGAFGVSSTVANARVVFGTPSGAVRAVGRTDILGKAAGDVAPGGMVTVAATTSCGNPPNFELYTIYDVEPGDDLVVLFLEEPAAGCATVPAPPITSTATLPGAYDTSTYAVSAGCVSQTVPSPTGTFVVDYDSACALDAAGHFNSLLKAMGALGVPAAYSTATGVSGFSSFSFGSWTPAGAFVISSFAHVPAFAPTYVGLDVQPLVGRFGYDHEGTVQTTPSVGATQAAIPQGFADSFLVTVTTSIESLPKVYVAASVSRQTTTTIASFDLASLPPYISDVRVDDSDPLRPRVTWGLSAPATLDGGEIFVRWADRGDAGVRVDHTWGAVVPNTHAVAFPALPDDLADFRPGPATPLAVKAVELFRSTALGSYAAFRANHLAFGRGAYLVAVNAPAGDFTTLASSYQDAP